MLRHLLTNAQNEKRVKIATELLRRRQEKYFTDNTIIIDKTWLPFNNPESQNAWLQLDQRRY
jgi:hypothetical protein